MAEKINLLLNDNTLVPQLNKNRIKQLEKFSIENIAKTVNEIYLKI
jgi:response regulator of citrate/malate metabolism